MKLLTYVLLASFFFFIYKNPSIFFIGDDPISFFLLIFLISLSILSIFILLFFSIISNKSIFYKLFLFVLGSTLTITTSYLIFIGNYVYRSYKFPEVILLHSISEALDGQVPTLFTRPYIVYMDNKIYINNFNNYQDYRDHSLNPIKNMQPDSEQELISSTSDDSSSDTNRGRTDSHIDSGYGSGSGYYYHNQSSYTGQEDYAENY